MLSPQGLTGVIKNDLLFRASFRLAVQLHLILLALKRSFAHIVCARCSKSLATLLWRDNRPGQLEKENGKTGNILADFSASLPRVHLRGMLNTLHLIRLDYLSCILTILATVLIGKKLWQGWVVAALNSAVVCVIGVRTAQFGFVPANLLCIALYTSNLVNWRPKKQDQ